MGLFDKKEKKLRNEFGKKSVLLCKESVKEIDEVYNDMKANYDTIETVFVEFAAFVKQINPKLDKEDAVKLSEFSSRLVKVDKCARDGVRDVRDLLRNQKKRLKEALNDI